MSQRVWDCVAEGSGLGLHRRWVREGWGVIRGCPQLDGKANPSQANHSPSPNPNFSPAPMTPP